MTSLFMFLEHVEHAETSLAVRTVEVVLSGVVGEVLLEAHRAGETFPAHVAVVGVGAGMVLHVALEVVARRVGLVALVAVERCWVILEWWKGE